MTFSALRRIKHFIFKCLAYLKFPFILNSFLRFKAKDKKQRFSLPFSDVYPCLFENTPYTRFDTHYVYHTAWAARKVQEINNNEHVDISSSLYFSGIVSAFKKVKFYDYRPAHLNLSNLESNTADLLGLSFATASISSLSCMHTVEHVGLGRYGDPIDPDGDIKAAKELSRVVSPGGSLLFVVPVGKPRIQFNAHRIYSYGMVKELFPEFEIREFSLIPDNALDQGMIYNATPAEADEQRYGCGCFWFIKKRA
jgi:SAM-dependent methyltransferase